jgi:hypothetical protein
MTPHLILFDALTSLPDFGAPIHAHTTNWGDEFIENSNNRVQFDHDATRHTRGAGVTSDDRQMRRCVTTADFLIYCHILLWKINARILLSAVHEVLARDPSLGALTDD